jgi:prepilin-type N-terminal cleavage/methylation domain-containing protein
VVVLPGALGVQGNSIAAIVAAPSQIEGYSVLQRLRAVRNQDSGFTLIELLITVVILGVLAGIVVFAVSAFNNDGVVAACRTDTKNVEVASEAYFAKSTTGTYAATIAALVAGGYLKESPDTAAAGSDKYYVEYTGGGAATAPTVAGKKDDGTAC